MEDLLAQLDAVVVADSDESKAEAIEAAGGGEQLLSRIDQLEQRLRFARERLSKPKHDLSTAAGRIAALTEDGFELR